MATPAADDGVRNDRRLDAEPRGFPIGVVTILCLAMTMNSYTLVSLFPYVGVMVKELLSLETTNEAGECGKPRKWMFFFFFSSL